MSTPPPRSAAYFDQWYADMARSPVKDETMQRHLGLPPHVLPNNSLPWAGVAEVTQALALRPGQRLLDLACGRGSVGLEVAGRTGAALVGVDFSAEALRRARASATKLGSTADFVLGRLEDTGLPDASVDAVVCIDSVQFSGPPEAVFGEVRRVLRPGGRLAATCWEVVDPEDERVPARLRGVHLEDQLRAAGFTDVDVVDRPRWRELELAFWAEAATLDPGDDPALQSFHGEGVGALAYADAVRRVLATATAP